MNGSQGAWGSLVPRLGTLLDDERVNVRSNMAMLTASLASNDPRALEALATIAARAIRTILHGPSTSDVEVLEAVLAERDRLPALDEAVARKLRTYNLESDPEIAAQDIPRVPAAALLLLPVRLLADAFISYAGRLAGDARGRGDPVERERLQARLIQLGKILNQAPPNFANNLRSALRDRLRNLDRRARTVVLLALLQMTPQFFESMSETAAIATRADIDRAARAGRPRLIPMLGRAIGFALIIGGILVFLIFGVLTVSHRSDVNVKVTDILGDAALEWLWVGFVAVTAALPAALLYTPSVGRSFRPMRSLGRALAPTVAAGLISAAVAVAFAGENRTLGLVVGDWPVADYLLLLLAITVTATLVIAITPAATRAFPGDANGGEIWAMCCAAGPAIATATVACGVATLFGLTAFSQFWPLIIATTASLAVSVTHIEIATRPTHLNASVQRDSRWPLIAAFGSAIPPALALIGVVLSFFLPQRELTRELTPRDHSWSEEFSLQPGQTLTFASDQSMLLREDFIASDHKVIVHSKTQDGKPNKNGSEMHVIVQGASTVCVDDCAEYEWPWMADWLPLLMTGNPVTGKRAKVHVRAEFTTPSPKPEASENIDLRKGAVELKLKAGKPIQVDLSDGKNTKVSVKGSGELGDLPLLAIFKLDENKQWDEEENDVQVYRLASGNTYELCVYFGRIEHGGCKLTDPNRQIFETGEATVRISPVEDTN